MPSQTISPAVLREAQAPSIPSDVHVLATRHPKTGLNRPNLSLDSDIRTGVLLSLGKSAKDGSHWLPFLFWDLPQPNPSQFAFLFELRLRLQLELS